MDPKFVAKAAASYTLLDGACSAAFSAVNCGDGVISGDPRFVNANGPDGVAGTGDENLRLLSGSPAIDAANNSAVLAGVVVDLAGGNRFVDDVATEDKGLGDAPIVDMGAYEYVTPNSAPTVTLTAPSYGGAFAMNTAVGLAAEITDPDASDVHTCTIDWNDGSPLDGEVVMNNSSTPHSVADSHAYSQVGVYEIVVSCGDGAGGTASVKALIVVYDPHAGFVTGGGSINSREGACVRGGSSPCDETVTGIAYFGFVSRYDKRTAVPQGQTEFEFEAGNLSFHSTSYDWLLVSGCYAQYKGVGAINGTAGYRFKASARDGARCSTTQQDGFRIQLWDQAGGLVYDNGLAAPSDFRPPTNPTVPDILQGSIVIHTTK